VEAGGRSRAPPNALVALTVSPNLLSPNLLCCSLRALCTGRTLFWLCAIPFGRWWHRKAELDTCSWPDVGLAAFLARG
jgi:hypothetical protein